MEDQKRWQDLCQQASTEQDSRKLVVLIEEINRLLAEKNDRLRTKSAGAD